MSNTEQIRQNVSRAYARAVSAPGSSCCGTAPKGTLARQAGYHEEELAAIPAEAVANSFGCGNPLAFARVREGDTVLDLGCGAGIDVVLAAGRVGRAGRVIGVDMTDEMIAKARAVAAAAGLSNVEIRKGLIEELPVETGSIDWVISNCVINLSAEKPRVFAEIARVLRPGGRMLVSDMIAENLPPAVLGDLSLFSCCVAGALSECDYREGLQVAGLAEIVIEKRMALTASQVAGVLESDRALAQPCCGSATSQAGTTELAAACEGKVFAATIMARKPVQAAT